MEELDLIGALRMMAEEIQWTHDDRRAAVMAVLDASQVYVPEEGTATDEDDHN